LIAVAIFALVAIGFIASREKKSENNTENNTSKTYKSEQYSFSFSYPQNYFLEERDLTTPQREQISLILTEDTEENRLVREGKSPGREGPIAVTIDVYKLSENEISDPLTWVQTTGGNASNWKLDGRNLIQTTVAGNPAVTYEWSGLYEARSTVLLHQSNIIMVTATYITPEDPTVAVYNAVLSTFSYE
jgi:hypothetical protein